MDDLPTLPAIPQRSDENSLYSLDPTLRLLGNLLDRRQSFLSLMQLHILHDPSAKGILDALLRALMRTLPGSAAFLYNEVLPADKEISMAEDFADLMRELESRILIIGDKTGLERRDTGQPSTLMVDCLGGYPRMFLSGTASAGYADLD